MEKFEIKRNDREIALEAVKKKGHMLDFLEKFQDDGEFVGESVEQNDDKLQFASEKLKCDIDIAALAVEEIIYALCYLNPELKEQNNGLFRRIVDIPKDSKLYRFETALCYGYTYWR